MKKIFSVVALSLMAACSSCLICSCGDDDEERVLTNAATRVEPLVQTGPANVKNSYTMVTGLVDWKGNTYHKELGFYVWSDAQPEPIFFNATNNNDEMFQAAIVYSYTVVGTTTIQHFKPGETVYYQAAAKKCKVNGTVYDVKGEVLSFVVGR